MGCFNRPLRSGSQLPRKLSRPLVLFVLLTYAAGLPAQTPGKRPSSPDTLQRHYDAARTYGLNGNLARSQSEFEAFLGEALRRIGNARANAGDVKSATVLLDEALSFGPENPDILTDRASAYLSAGQLDDANRLALKAVRPGETSPRLEYLLGRILMQKADYKAAKDHLEKSVAANPTFNVAFALASTYLNLKDLQHAQLLFRDMIVSLGDSAALHVRIARTYREAQYWDPAIDELKKTAARFPKAGQVHYFTGLAYMERDDAAGIPAAVPEFLAELQIDPNDYRSRYMLGYTLMKQGDAQRAESELTKASALEPENPDPWHLLAQLYLQGGRKDEAEQAARKEIALTKDESASEYQVGQTHYLLGRLLLEAGKKEEGMRELNLAEQMSKRRMQAQVAHLDPGDAARMAERAERATNLNGLPHDVAPEEKKKAEQFVDQLKPAVADAYNNLGVMAAGRKDFVLALSYFEKARTWNPSLDKLDRNQGMAAFYASAFQKAVPLLFRELQAHPGDVRVRVALGFSYFGLENYSAVIETFQELASKPDADPGVSATLAQALIKTGRYDQGMAILKSMASGNANSAEVYQFLGSAYADQGIYASAVEEYRRSLALDASQQRTHFLLGLAFIRQGNWADAVPELRTANQLNSEDVSAKYHLAYALVQTGQKAEAAKLLTEVIAQDKNHSDAHYQMGKLQLEQGDVKGAIGNLEAASQLSPKSDYIHYQLAQAYRRDSRMEDAVREMKVYQELKDSRRGSHEQARPE